MDRKLVEYVEASRSFSRQVRSRTYAVATDKASVGGLGSGLQTTVFVVGQTNTAILGIPQALSLQPWFGSVPWAPLVRKSQTLPRLGARRG